MFVIILMLIRIALSIKLTTFEFVSSGSKLTLYNLTDAQINIAVTNGGGISCVVEYYTTPYTLNESVNMNSMTSYDAYRSNIAKLTISMVSFTGGAEVHVSIDYGVDNSTMYIDRTFNNTIYVDRMVNNTVYVDRMVNNTVYVDRNKTVYVDRMVNNTMYIDRYNTTYKDRYSKSATTIDPQVSSPTATYVTGSIATISSVAMLAELGVIVALMRKKKKLSSIPATAFETIDYQFNEIIDTKNDKTSLGTMIDSTVISQLDV